MKLLRRHNIILCLRERTLRGLSTLARCLKTYIIKNQLMASRHFHKTIVTHNDLPAPSPLYHSPQENNLDPQAIKLQQASQAFFPVAVCGAPLS
jgi:hypothetical protein